MPYFKLIFLSIVISLNTLSAGQIIEVCGIDGAGKSTFCGELQQALTAKGYKVMKVTPLRGDAKVYPFLDAASQLQQTSENPLVPPLVENFKSDFFKLSFLIGASKIEDTLQEYDYILCDRYFFSFVTYQKCFNQLSPDDDVLLSDIPRPAYTFLVTVPVEVAIERIAERGKADSYENIEFLTRAQQIFIDDCHQHLPLYRINGELPMNQNIDYATSILLDGKR